MNMLAIKDEIKALGLTNKLELYFFTKEQIELERSSKSNLKFAAESLLDCYQNDSELTAFSTIESEYYEAE